jgi:hypothetical protein
MFTPADLRQALVERELPPPDVDAFIEHLAALGTARAAGAHATHTASPSRRRAVPLTVAATVVVVACAAVGGTLLRDRAVRTTGQPPAATATSRPAVTSSVSMPLGPAYRFSFGFAALAPGQQAFHWEIMPTFQWAMIGTEAPKSQPGYHPMCTPPPGQSSCSYSTVDGFVPLAAVLVYPEGGFDASALAGARHVYVNGAAGLEANIAPLNDTVKWSVATVDDPAKPPLLTTVAWQYAPGSWAVVAWRNSTDRGADGLALAVARTVRPGLEHTARVPFAVDYLPQAVDRRWGLVYTGGHAATSVTFASASSAQDPALQTGPPDDALPISLSTDADLTAPSQPGDTKVTVNGRPGVYSPRLSALLVGCGTHCVLTVGYGMLDAHLAGALTETELVKVAQHIRLAADPSDPATWFDASTAMPH